MSHARFNIIPKNILTVKMPREAHCPLLALFSVFYSNEGGYQKSLKI